MALDTGNFTVNYGALPGLKNQKSVTMKLLRKPRAPAPPRPPDISPPPKSYNSEFAPFSNLPDYDLYEAERLSTDQSVHQSTISAPPPSEFYSKTYSDYKAQTDFRASRSEFRDYATRSSTRKTPRSTYFKKGDLKYVLDPLYREKTSLGTYVEGQTLVKPYKTRGPDGLPMRSPKHNTQVVEVDWDENQTTMSHIERPQFTLRDFLQDISEVKKIPVAKVSEVMFSKYTYKKLQKLLLAQCVPPTKEVATIEMKPSDDMPRVTPRVPQRQLLIEMAALVQEQMSDIMQTDMKSVIRPLPKYSPTHGIGSTAPHTEIVLYEDDTFEDYQDELQRMRQTELPSREGIFHGATSRYFQGSRRSNSPFAMPDETLISPAELAVLDALMNGGKALSLKANFISSLPDIEPLIVTITYLNLSFNEFMVVPNEVLELRQLKVLKMRDNPVKELPPDIGRLINLRILVVSFCLVSSLPPSLFKLEKLEHLDLAYNRLSYLPNEIKSLRKLRELNLEGNQLPAMPIGALRLSRLKNLNVQNNYMHPLFWKENSKNQPQRLLDLAALNIQQTGLRSRYTNLPESVVKILDSFSDCDCCKAALYGAGVRVIRPISKIYGIKNLPFLFRCCSVYCKDVFLSNTDTLTEMLYG